MDQRIIKLAKNLVNHSCRLKEGEKVLIEAYGDTTKDLVKALVKEAYSVGALPFKLAKNLVNHSCRLKEGEKVLIEAYGDTTKDLVKALVKEAYSVGALPFVTIKDNSILRAILKDCSVEQLQHMAKYELERMKDMHAYIGIRGGDNSTELSDVADEKMKLYSQYFMNPVHMAERVNNTKWVIYAYIGIRGGDNSTELSDVADEKMKLYSQYFMNPVHMAERVNNTKWVILRYPNNSMAQLANTSLEAFEDFYFDVCCLDYSKMEKAMDSLCDLLSKTDKVRIKGVGTDLTFSIKDIPNVKCFGLRNIPDGEVYTAPVRESVNGVLYKRYTKCKMFRT